MLFGRHGSKAGKSLTISGIVVDKSSDKEPIIGANIFLKDRPGVGTTTDLMVDLKFRHIKAMY